MGFQNSLEIAETKLFAIPLLWSLAIIDAQKSFVFSLRPDTLFSKQLASGLSMALNHQIL